MSIRKAERNAISRTAIGISIGSVFAQTDSPRDVAAKNAVANQEKRIDEFELRKDDPEFAGGAIPASHNMLKQMGRELAALQAGEKNACSALSDERQIDDLSA